MIGWGLLAVPGIMSSFVVVPAVAGSFVLTHVGPVPSLVVVRALVDMLLAGRFAITFLVGLAFGLFVLSVVRFALVHRVVLPTWVGVRIVVSRRPAGMAVVA